MEPATVTGADEGTAPNGTTLRYGPVARVKRSVTRELCGVDTCLPPGCALRAPLGLRGSRKHVDVRP